MLGEELLKARLAAGLTQEQVARTAGISRNYVSMLEHDEGSPTVATFFDLCRALGIRPSVLIARVERRAARGR